MEPAATDPVSPISAALVTGAGGFIGGGITRALVRRGVAVRTLARGHYPWIDELGATQIRGDLADADTVRHAVGRVDVVFHVAAKAGAWGAADEFERINVRGTVNVIDACLVAGVKALVYTSSPSVIFDGRDMEGVDESVPYPAHYESHYARTKSEAERAVLAADPTHHDPGASRAGESTRTVALRPHLVWGPGDTNLCPRIIERAQAGRLRRMTGPTKYVDVTYVDDVVSAHLLAAEALLAGPPTSDRVGGRAYFISGARVATFEMIDRILEAAGLPHVPRAISPTMARWIGAAAEAVWTITGREDEPPMTRWVASELATSHWFDTTAAARDLGFRPQISLDDGLRRLAEWYRDNPVARGP